MPIQISDYVWHQTAKKVILTLDLHHTSLKNVDIVSTSSYLKVNFQPYIFEVFLVGHIDTEKSRARAVEGRLELELTKKVADVEWEAVCLQLTVEEKKLRRQQAREELQELENMRAKKKKDEQIARERHSVAQQISSDDRAREEREQAIENLKKEFLAISDISDSPERENDDDDNCKRYGDDDDENEWSKEEKTYDDDNSKQDREKDNDDDKANMKRSKTNKDNYDNDYDNEDKGKIDIIKALKKIEMCNSRENHEKHTENMTELTPPRRRWSSAGSEDSAGGSRVTGEHDYDGDGEDSIHYSSSENLCNLQVKRRTEVFNRNRKKSILSRKEEKERRGERERREDSEKGESERKGENKETRRMEEREKKGERERRVEKNEERVKKGERERRENEEARRKGRKKIPGVRQCGRIIIRHTPRVFPTPSRESTQNEEEQWLSTQSVIGGDNKASIDTTTPSLDNFKKKAVFLFKNGDYCGCVNACTEALTLSPSTPCFYSNRAAANIAIGNLHHAVNDCSKALELLTPATADNLKSRLLCHVRRGTALVRLGLVAEGLLDYKEALCLAPDDTSLQSDVMRLQNLLIDTEDESDSGCEDTSTRIA